MKTPLRRTAAAGALLLLILGLSACGFSEQTDQVYQPATGVNNRGGGVDVLNTLIVSAADGSGTLITSLVNNNQKVPDELIGVNGDGLTASPTQVAVPAGGLVNFADGKPVTITGANVKAGNFVRITLSFENAKTVTMNIPVVTNTGDYADVKVKTAKPPHQLMGTLILLRHGESEWNALNLFTGWVDVALTEKGRGEAIRGGEQLVEAGLLPDVVHTSLLRRAITTAHFALDAADRHWIPVRRDWRLNERHYGALQGKDKKQTLEEYGEEQFMSWRRSFDVPPPPIADDDEYSQAGDLRYAPLGAEMPRTECLKDVIDRLLPYWDSAVVPDLQSGATVLVAAHGNSLRAIVKHLDQISDDDIAGLNIPTGMPLVYDLDDAQRPTVPGGRYLDPEAAAEAAAAVASQGR